MKNIEKKIQTTFTTDEIDNAKLFSLPPLYIIKILLIILGITIYYFINHCSLLSESREIEQLVYTLSIMIIASLSFFIFAFIIDNFELLNKTNSKKNILLFIKNRNKNILKFKKHFLSIHNVLDIRRRLIDADIELSDENYTKFYMNYEIKVLNKIENDFNLKIKEETNKINKERHEEIIKETKKTIEMTKVLKNEES